MIKADILLALIFSLRIKDENIVISRGAIKNIAVHSAIGRETIPRKKNKLAKTNSIPLKTCATGLLVLSALRPPSKGKKRIKVKIKAVADLIKIISCNG